VDFVPSLGPFGMGGGRVFVERAPETQLLMDNDGLIAEDLHMAK
jgi:hypothetical protein